MMLLFMVCLCFGCRCLRVIVLGCCVVCLKLLLAREQLGNSDSNRAGLNNTYFLEISLPRYMTNYLIHERRLEKTVVFDSSC